MILESQEKPTPLTLASKIKQVLSIQELNPNMTSLKVKVPEEAVKSKRDLRRFLQQSAEDHDCDILSIGYETNIWDDEKDDFVFD